MDITLMLGERAVQLGCEGLESLIGSLPDDDESLTDLLHELAQSNIAGVREAVARKRAISEETVAKLASDTGPEVIDALVSVQCSKLSEAALCRIIQRNWSRVNRQIAQNVEYYDQTDITAVSNLLAGNSDPSVRVALASNRGAPKLVVRQLLNDPDPDVRRLARDTLKPL